MSRIFFQLFGGTTDSLEKQSWWKDIQELKRLAIEDMNRRSEDET
jgi:hypothetical protein